MSLLTVKISLQSARSKKCESSKCFAYWGGEKPKKLTGIRKLFKIRENSLFNFKKTCLLKKISYEMEVASLFNIQLLKSYLDCTPDENFQGRLKRSCDDFATYLGF